MSPSATSAPARRPDPVRLRGDEAALFAAQQAALWRAVRRAVHGPDSVIDDACQTAWTIMLRAQPDRKTLLGWLVTVATHEAWRLSASDRRDCPLTRAEDADLSAMEAVRDDRDPAGRAIARLDAQARLRAVAATLPARQRDLIAWQAVGYSRAELAALTGATPSTVNRQLDCAKRRLDPLREPRPA